MSSERPITLQLNHYQAANLRWLLRVAWDCPASRYPPLNTGDWVGEIPQMLEQEMIEHDVTQPPNATDEWAQKPLTGLYDGAKRADSEKEKIALILYRVRQLLALKNTPLELRVILCEEALKGWWGFNHKTALERG